MAPPLRYSSCGWGPAWRANDHWLFGLGSTWFDVAWRTTSNIIHPAGRPPNHHPAGGSSYPRHWEGPFHSIPPYPTPTRPNPLCRLSPGEQFFCLCPFPLGLTGKPREGPRQAAGPRHGQGSGSRERGYTCGTHYTLDTLECMQLARGVCGPKPTCPLTTITRTSTRGVLDPSARLVAIVSVHRLSNQTGLGLGLG